MTRAMLLCAGKGSRLGELSEELPKPLLPVCDIPILRFGITHLVASGIQDIVINLHHRGDLIRKELGDGSDMGAHIQYSEETHILGTGGGLKHALHLLDPEGRDEPFICLNGKLIFDFDVRELLGTHEQAVDSLGTMVLQPAGNALQWGAVDVGLESGHGIRVHNILGSGTMMFCGVHVTRPSVVSMLPDGEACMVRQGYLPWIQAGKRVSAYIHDKGYFAEHSTPKRYLQSSVDLLQGEFISHPPGELRGIDASARIDPSATIVNPVRIAKGVVIGAHCRIGPNVILGDQVNVAQNSSLKNCVVWKHTDVKGAYENSILTPERIQLATGADEVD